MRTAFFSLLLLKLSLFFAFTSSPSLSLLSKIFYFKSGLPLLEVGGGSLDFLPCEGLTKGFSSPGFLLRRGEGGGRGDAEASSRHVRCVV